MFLSTSLLLFTALVSLKDSKNVTNPSTDPKAAVTYSVGTIILADQTISESILIQSTANVSLVNSTVIGDVYIFYFGFLNVLENSTITGNIVVSDYSHLMIDNSTVGGSIECRDSSSLLLNETINPFAIIWKFDSANMTIKDSNIGSLMEYGTGGEIRVYNSDISLLSCYGMYPSQVLLNNTTVGILEDNSKPLNVITGPITSFDLLSLDFNRTYSTSERIINLTWRGWESPIVDGYMNLSFQILVDGQLYDTVNGSGYFTEFEGNLLVNIGATGTHNISVYSVDGHGNNFTSTVTIEIVEYPTFVWSDFLIGVAICGGIIVVALIFLHVKSQRGYYSALGTIFKKELGDNKSKILLFALLGAVPGIILRLLFGYMNSVEGVLSIDAIRGLVNTIFTIFILYFGFACCIIFGMGSVIKDKTEGTLAWFVSKPIRRWEFLWGKIFAYFLIILLVITSMAISFILSGIGFINAEYLPDLFSMGGYLFIIGLVTLIPLISIVILLSAVFSKIGAVIAIPAILLMVLPALISFIPIIIGNEWPLLFSFSYYVEKLGSTWVSTSGGLFGSLTTMYGSLFGRTITTLDLDVMQIVLALLGIASVCLALATILLRRKDLP